MVRNTKNILYFLDSLCSDKLNKMDAQNILDIIIQAKISFQKSSGRLPQKVIINKEDILIVIRKQVMVMYSKILTPNEEDEWLKGGKVFGLEIEINEKLQQGKFIIK